MRRAIVLAAVFAFSFVASTQAATRCTDPKTHKFITCPAPAPAPAPARVTPASNTTSHAPHCTKGKVCGNTCIAQTAVCHAH